MKDEKKMLQMLWERYCRMKFRRNQTERSAGEREEQKRRL
ncbi:hypothetical protein OESDEN_25343 [Oesophagostomum dentatum]|uniref:Uncharacterized protein n=1 Tax=Oesophagostomum dentatum TaxID=61180 RepID=A0A0B1RTS6_OESDE|nr:hypothetical protein OESDEN_25343 [Oesophagostomum dentatum]